MNLKPQIKQKLHAYYKSLEIKEHHLSYLFLEITRKCNLDCLHCGSDCKAEINFPELTTDSWIRIIDYIEQSYSKSVAFVLTGGEPLIHPDIYKIGQHINKKGMRWGMVTNGIALNKNRLTRLIDSGIYSITLSLDGLEESHNWLRNNKNAFKKTSTALSLIGNSNIAFKDVVTCVSPKNLYELNDIADFLIENKIKEWRLFRIFPSGRAKNNKDLNLTFEQTQEMLQFIVKNKKVYQAKGLNINLSCEGWVPMQTDLKVRDNPFFCRAGINIASILSDGTITGCTNNDESFHVGNILNDNFSFVWENHFDIFRKREWISDTDCANCKHIKQCQGSSIHLWEMGDKKPKFCYAVDLDCDSSLRTK
ncbi:MAG: radical SAM/SPASM domain-containing protein [Bacteroidetes bacterium]|nr:MAG: radical SAM/SPASM domain-containing protein [Bacteroidota bacterium]